MCAALPSCPLDYFPVLHVFWWIFSLIATYPIISCHRSIWCDINILTIFSLIFILYYIILCHIILYYIISEGITSCVISHYMKSHYVIQCRIISYNIILYYITSINIILYEFMHHRQSSVVLWNTCCDRWMWRGMFSFKWRTMQPNSSRRCREVSLREFDLKIDIGQWYCCRLEKLYSI